MPFEILTPFAGATLPLFEVGENNLPRTSVEAVPNVDAMGGQLEVTASSLASGVIPATATLQYTDVDGVVTSTTVNLPDGYSVDLGEGVVFGDSLDRFLIGGTRVGTLADGQPGTAVTMLEVGIDGEGAPQSLGFDNSVRPELYDEGSNIIETLELYPLGDGRVGWITNPDPRDDWGIGYGAISNEKGSIEALKLGHGVHLGGHAIALDNGGILFVTSDPGGMYLSITQFDEDGTELGGQFFSYEAFDSTKTSLTEDDQVTLLVNDDGELDVYITAQDGTTYRVEYDLLPLVEPEIVGTGGDDILTLTDADDVFDALGGDDKVIGGEGDDVINGGSGADLLRGSAGDDVLSGDNGADTLFGGDGDDILKGNQGFDRLIGGQGNDSLYGGRGKDVLHGGDGHDYIDGGSSDDVLRGGDGNDEIYGGDGADMVSGGAGNDTLYGGEGDDQLTGGSGADVFSYDLIVDQDEDIEAIEANDTGIDTIHDFAIGEDKIAFDGNPLVQGENEAGPQLVAGDLTFDDIFLSQEDSVAVIQAGETTIRLESVHADDLSEDDFLFT